MRDYLACYHRAAAQEHPAAQSALGVTYTLGLNNTEKNLDLGRYWVKKAAIYSDLDALLLLAHVYETGIGVPRSEIMARDLYTRAAAQGDPTAKKKVGLL